jgi:murein DD-endopeptidase MepM/ murein hydrolase activator NlpD
MRRKASHTSISLIRAGVIALVAVSVFSSLTNPQFVHAQGASADALQSQISDANQKIAALEKEIEGLSANLDTTSKQARTLRSALSALELTKTKLEKDLSLTTSKIKKATLTLSELSQNIATTEQKIAKSSEVIAQSIRNTQIAEDQSVLQELLGQKSISEAWDYVNALRTIRGRLTSGLVELGDLKQTLGTQRASTEKEKTNLVTLQKNLSGQKQVVEYNKTEKSKLLTSTQNSAAVYQTQLAEKKKQKEQFENELFDYESKLKLVIDPKSIPSARSGVFSWPLANVRITQSFGVTTDSVRLYKSGTHNGVDFGAPVGTPIRAVLSGTIQATGNTDLQKGCYSYGKWVLIKHPNGLSSLYAHLSVISVNAGDTVATGDRIGYSGATGYATGPHLHLTVLASQGVQVQQYTSSINCKYVTIPLADVKAYLNPMSYLPTP